MRHYEASHESNLPYIWVTNFNEEDVIDFYNQFMFLESQGGIERIIIYINSYGGDVYGYLAMRDLIKRSTKEVITVVVGKAMSAGALLAVSAEPGCRYAGPQSKYLVHQVQTYGIDGSGTDVNLKAKAVKDLNDNILKNLSEDTGKPMNFWKSIYLDKNVDHTFSATEAVEMGVVDHLTIPTVITSVISDIGVVRLQLEEEQAPTKTKRKKRK